MFPPGPSSASWVSLRCQLCQTFRVPLSSRLPARHISANRIRQFSQGLPVRNGDGAEEGHYDDSSKNSEKGPYVYRKLYPQGKIIGRPGRRQRETSEKLQITSLNQPSEVVVLRDVRERPSGKTAIPASDIPKFDSEEISKAVAEQDVEPTQEEINFSIDALRPETSVLVNATYEQLLKTLIGGYSRMQLASYLRKELTFSDEEVDSVRLVPEKSVRPAGGLQRSKWRSGQTPLEKRHSSSTVIRKTQIAKSKPRLAKQILELGWNLSVDSDDQRLGELEISLESWQTSLLFDITEGGQPLYQKIVGSELLLREAGVRPYRPDNIARVTARRQIAEEVAQQLETHLSSITRVTLDFRVFEPLLGTESWPEDFKGLYHENELREIRALSKSVIEWVDDKTMAIYNLSGPAAQSARRLLLSYLELPFSGKRATTEARVGLSDETPNLKYLPSMMTSTLHARHRRHVLTRLVTTHSRKPSRSKLGPLDYSGMDEADSPQVKLSSPNLDGVGEEIAKDLESVSTSTSWKPYRSGRPSYWTVQSQVSPKSWSAQFCCILQQQQRPASGKGQGLTKSKNVEASSATPDNISILQPQAPGILDLLSFFKPIHRPSLRSSTIEEARPPHLIARLIPSPFATGGLSNLVSLPRIQMRYVFDSVGKERTQRDIRLAGMTATVEDQGLRVPLPTESNDLFFSRTTDLHSENISPTLVGDPHIRNFTHTVRHSVLSGRDALVGDPTITLKLPAWLNGSKAGEEEFEVEYHFDGFEHVQVVDFVPLDISEQDFPIDDEVQPVLKAFPQNAFLRYREIQAGVVGGRWSDLTLIYTTASTDDKKSFISGERESMKESSGDSPGDIVDNGEANGPPSALGKSPLILANTALALTRLLSRINEGSLRHRPIRRPKHEPEEEDEGSSEREPRRRSDRGRSAGGASSGHETGRRRSYDPRAVNE